MSKQIEKKFVGLSGRDDEIAEAVVLQEVYEAMACGSPFSIGTIARAYLIRLVGARINELAPAIAADTPEGSKDVTNQ